MTETKTSFSFPSARNLCRYLGETDAMAELTELAARSFVSSAAQSGDIPAYISAASKLYSICVNLAEVESFSHHLARSYVVTVYQSAERFLHEFRREHRGLYQKEWIGDAENVDPLTVTMQNIAGTEDDAADRIGRDLVSRFQYYRLVRNWVVHTKGSDIGKPQAKFGEIVPYSETHKDIFASVQAPNPPDSLTFDDFILFSRLCKRIAENICAVAQPASAHWARLMPLKRFKRLGQNPQRMRNAVAGRLRTEYGMDNPTARWIADELCGSLA